MAAIAWDSAVPRAVAYTRGRTMEGRVLQGRRILLIISGGIAAYKSLELIRRLRDRGAAVRCVMTEAAKQFVTPLSIASLSENKVYSDLWSLTDESEMGHIRLSREADLVVAAPATADLIARMAAGLGDDLAATALLASDKPVMIAPAMNAQMWAHPATQANLATLTARGVRRIGPGAVFFQAEDGIRGTSVTGVQTCALPISAGIPVVAAQRPRIRLRRLGFHLRGLQQQLHFLYRAVPAGQRGRPQPGRHPVRSAVVGEIGRASCRERG